MTCTKIKNGFICDFAEHRNYICFEHTTYLMEFSERFGPAWFTVPGDENIFPEPDGHLSILWDIFEEWLSNLRKPVRQEVFDFL